MKNMTRNKSQSFLEGTEKLCELLPSIIGIHREVREKYQRQDVKFEAKDEFRVDHNLSQKLEFTSVVPFHDADFRLYRRETIKFEVRT